MDSPRYTVARALRTIDGATKSYYMILANGLPAVEINKHLIVQQMRQARAVSTPAYTLAAYLNHLDNMGLSFYDATMEVIYDYLYAQMVEDGKTYQTIMSYICAIEMMYESLAARNYKLDESLLRKAGDHVRVRKNRKSVPLTKISMLRKEFYPRTLPHQNIYTKWYTREEIEAIAAELPLVYRCIFFDTIFTGHRVDSALSLTLNSVDLRTRQVFPTRTKTGQKHISLIPAMLAEMINTYLIEDRANIVVKTGSSSPYLFLGRTGEPVTYTAYNQALRTAGIKASTKHPELGPIYTHTHAGRSTFAAALRTYQLSQQRANIKTFSDPDFCTLMDWKSLSCLENYDLATRAMEVSPILEDFYHDMLDIASLNRLNEVILDGTSN